MNQIMGFLMFLLSSADQAPIVGTWTITVDGCVETYQYQADGTLESASHQERITRMYALEKRSDRLYRLTAVPVESNELPSCAGTISKLSEMGVIQAYIRFNDERDSFVIFWDLSDPEAHQLGPFKKK